MLMSEDCTAAKLAGYNCIIKFIDGEYLFLKVRQITDETEHEWFTSVEDFLNNEPGSLFPYCDMAVPRNVIKYVKKI